MFRTLFTAILGVFMFAGSASACFLSGERMSGLNKICYYDCVDGTKAITIRATSLCPLSINYSPGENDKNESDQIAQLLDAVDEYSEKEKTD